MTQHQPEISPESVREDQVTDAAAWNEVLARLPAAHFLQTWEWGAFKSRHGWQPARCWWIGKGAEPWGAASILTRRLTRWGPAVMYVPKGPALDYARTDLLELALSRLEAAARQQGALFIKLDPDVQRDTAQGQAAMETLRQRGWRASGEQIQFRNTMLLDLAPDADRLLAGFKSKWRYNVRLATRKGVTVRQGGVGDLPLLYDMYAETSARDGFVIRPVDYYRDAWGSFIEAGLAQPLIAEVEGDGVAMVILFQFAGRAWYLYGASRNAHRKKMPNHLLQWEAIRWAQAQGCYAYDMWGAPDVLEESDPLWGVYRFKQGFGARYVQHIGAWDYVVSPLGYWLYTTAIPRVLDVMRWAHWRLAGRR